MKYASLDQFLQEVAARNPGQPEFLQAVTEVMESLWPFIEKNTKYADNALLERLVRASPGPMREEQLRAVYREILAMSRQLQAPQRHISSIVYYKGDSSRSATLRMSSHFLKIKRLVRIQSGANMELIRLRRKNIYFQEFLMHIF